jgi:hypothetical protein
VAQISHVMLNRTWSCWRGPRWRGEASPRTENKRQQPNWVPFFGAAERKQGWAPKGFAKQTRRAARRAVLLGAVAGDGAATRLVGRSGLLPRLPPSWSRTWRGFTAANSAGSPAKTSTATAASSKVASRSPLRAGRSASRLDVAGDDGGKHFVTDHVPPAASAVTTVGASWARGSLGPDLTYPYPAGARQGATAPEEGPGRSETLVSEYSRLVRPLLLRESTLRPSLGGA